MSTSPIISVNVGTLPLTGSILSGDANPVLEQISSLSSNLTSLSNSVSGEIFNKECTDWEFRQKFAKLWEKFGGGVVERIESVFFPFVTSLFLVGSLFADDVPAGMMEHRNIRPSDKVVTNAWMAVEGDVTDKIAQSMVSKQDKLPYDTNAIPQSAVAGLETKLDTKQDTLPYPTNMIPQSVIDPPISPVPAEHKKYAMFIIPLNDTFVTNEYLDIELKASTNNFGMLDSTTPQTNRLVYYCHTSVTNEPPKFDDFMLFVENQEGHDSRSYVKIPSALPLGDDATVTRFVMIVSPGLCRRTDGKWLDSQNDEIVWTYARSTPGSMEPIREHGSRWVWRPIAPVRWFSELPKWANQPVQY